MLVCDSTPTMGCTNTLFLFFKYMTSTGAPWRAQFTLDVQTTVIFLYPRFNKTLITFYPVSCPEYLLPRVFIYPVIPFFWRQFTNQGQWIRNPERMKPRSPTQQGWCILTAHCGVQPVVYCKFCYWRHLLTQINRWRGAWSSHVVTKESWEFVI